ncbi:MAG TPA: archaeosortase/exosortase family protein, partial [Urbifossiella sp.]|nr:archaeosortase/exosortase family protein [Urbifossiella sp.]
MATSLAGGRPLESVTRAAAFAVVAWVFWPTLQTMADRWAHDPRYSHGYLVPFFSAYLLWSRRGDFAGADHR